MKREPGTFKDGWTTLLGGMNSAVETPLLDPSESAMLGNITVRGGFPETRPGFKPIKLTYEDSEVQDWIANHHFQGGQFFTPSAGDPYAIVSIAGRIFKVTLEGYFSEITPTNGTTVASAFISPPIGLTVVVDMASVAKVNIGYPATIASGKYIIQSINGTLVTVMNLSDTPGVLIAAGSPILLCDPNSPTQPQVWTVQAEDWFFLQDNQAACIIFDGIKAVRADPTVPEVPTGSAMEYYHACGRLAVAVGDTVALSDITTDTVSDIRKFKEEHDIVGGGRYKAPSAVTALSNIGNLDTTFGKGPLMVGFAGGVVALNLPPDRTAWPKTDSLQTGAILSYGPRSQNGTVLVNGDIFYRAEDGWRSLIAARRNFGDWGNTPISAEMNVVLKNDDIELLQYSSAVLFGNRLLLTCSPRPINPYGWYHAGIIALDFNTISTMAKKAPPVYDGLWTGIQPILLLKTTVNQRERCFAFTRDGSALGFWEITLQNQFDSDGGRPVCWIESRAFFGQGSNEFDMKQVVDLQLWWDHVVGKVDIDVKYRPDQYPCWFDWNTRTLCAKAQECQSNDICVPNTTYEPGYKTRMALRSPQAICETFDGKPSDHGYTFEVRIQWTGRARLKRALLKLRDVVEEITPSE